MPVGEVVFCEKIGSSLILGEVTLNTSRSMSPMVSSACFGEDILQLRGGG